MGCLNSEGKFAHWFGNIHLSGPCNRSCYFCIGQHMMALDSYNVLDKFPLDNLETFIEQCKAKNVHEVNLTGSNTDPLLYRHSARLKERLLQDIPNLVFGIRTNGVLSEQKEEDLKLFDKGSITICSLNQEIYRKMMGSGLPPDLETILPLYSHFSELKINIVLGDENIETKDILRTIEAVCRFGIKKVNIREPYGQANIGDPLEQWGFVPESSVFRMPCYSFGETKVTYWDVHYVEVESVNLYANGVVSETYPITKGCDPVRGKVLDQRHFGKGRHVEQWVSKTK